MLLQVTFPVLLVTSTAVLLSNCLSWEAQREWTRCLFGMKYLPHDAIAGLVSAQSLASLGPEAGSQAPLCLIFLVWKKMGIITEQLPRTEVRMG